MTEERIREIAENIAMGVMRIGHLSWSETIKKTEESIRLAIKESNEEKDEVICRLADGKSLTPAQKSELIRIYNQ